MNGARLRAVMLLAALCAASPAYPAGLEEANQLYRRGDAAGAAQAYETLLARRPSAALYFNLGNACFKQGSAGSLGRAIAAYLKAYERAPRDSDIRHNLEFALRRAGESLVPGGTPRALYFLFESLSWRELLGLQWLGYWACLLLGAAYLLRVESRPRLKTPVLAALVFWAGSASWLGLRYLAAPSSPGVIVEPNAEARSGPGLNFPVSFNAPEGRRVSVLSESNGWLEIGVLKEGLKGWIPSKNIERIDQ